MWRVLVGVICFFPLSAHAAQREYVSAWFVDSLINVFPDTPAATSKLEPTLISARNGHASLQVALRSESNRQLMLHVTAPRLLNGALSLQIYRVADVNVKSHPAETSLDEVVRSEVGPYPDPLFPLGKEISLEASRTQALWLSVATPKGTLPGIYRDRKSTRLNSSHSQISYAVFCLKKKKYTIIIYIHNLSNKL